MFTEELLLMAQKSHLLPRKQIGVAVIYNQQGRVLIARRPTTGVFGGFWEFPGGKVEDGETVQDCIKREILEELGIDIEVEESIITIDHLYPQFEVELMVYRCRYLHGEPQPLGCDEFRWVKVDELTQFTFPPANTQIISLLRKQHP